MRTSGRGTRRRALTRANVIVAAGALACAAALVAAPSVASATTSPRVSATSVTPSAFRTYDLAHGETARNVCSFAVGPNEARCDVLVRTDPAADDESPARGGAHPDGTIGDGGAYSPAFLQSAYNVASADSAGRAGAGQIVAVVDAYSDPDVVSDLAAYRSYFDLPTCPSGVVSASTSTCVFEQVNEEGATSPLPGANTTWAAETALDVEMVSAICPACQILLVAASSTSTSDLGQGVNTAVTMGASVVSNSYTVPEYAGEVYDGPNYYEHPGVAVVAAAGDAGYGVNFPAADPDVVAVGGTTLTQSTDTGTRDATETAWDDSGAGCSAYESKPSWQHDTGCPGRTVTDVSSDADPATGVWVYNSYDVGGTSDFQIAGGTSVATPIVGAMFALAGNSTTSTTFAPSWLYNDPSALAPVSSGSDGPCGTYLCNAADSQNGYNGPTGLGTPGGSPNSLAAFTAPPSPPPPTVPSAPALNSASPGNGTVTLSWSAPSNPGSSPVTGYNVFEGTTAGEESATPVNSVPLTATNDTVTGLTNSRPYYFDVEALNSVGASVASNEMSATPFLPQAPTAPALSSAQPENASVVLTWTAPASDGTSTLEGYDVFLGTSANGESTTPLNESLLTATGDTVTGLTNGAKYYFTVKAVNAVGKSNASNELSATPIQPAAPSSPTLSPAQSADGSVTLSWTPPSSDGTSALEGYDVFMGTSAGGESPTPLNGSLLSGTTDTVTGLANGTTYYFTVEAVNTVGSSSSSNEVSATPFQPAAPSSPTITSAEAENGAISLSWQAPSSDGTSSLEGYDVFVGTNPNGEGSSPINASLITATVDNITGLMNGTTYYFTVKAVNSVGASSASNETSATPFLPTTPSAPTLTVASRGNGSVTLTWVAPTSDGTSPLEGYDVFLGTASGGEGEIPINGTLIASTSDTITGLSNGTTYYFVVSAVSAVGSSEMSAELSATPVAPASPSAPTLSSATRGNATVALVWTAPASDGTSPLEGYDVFVGASKGGESKNPVNTSLLTSTSDTISSLTNGTTYYFVVSAVNAVGSSPMSKELSAEPEKPAAPSAPKILTVKTGNAMATITWSAPATVGTSPLEGYDVYATTTASGSLTKPTNSTLLKTTTATVTKLVNGTTYYFTVTAVNAVGASPPATRVAAKPVTTPGVISSLSGKLAAGAIKLTWTAPGSGGSAITAYEVYRSTKAGGEVAYAKVTCTTTTCTYLNRSVSASFTYYYELAAVNVVGTGKRSSPVSVKG